MKIKVKEVPILLEKVFVITALFLYSGAVLPHLTADGGWLQGSFIVKAMWGGIYGTIVLLSLIRWKQMISGAKREVLILFLVGIAFLSYLWSDHSITLKKGSTLIVNTLFGIYLAARYRLDELLRLLAWALLLTITFSLIFALFFPEYGLDHEVHEGAWKGAFPHKNSLGRMMVLSSAIYILLVLKSRRYRWLCVLGCILSLSLLILSTSKTALVIFMTLLVLLPLFRALRWKYTLVIPLLIFLSIIAGGAALWFLSHAEEVLGSLGRDMTLSGRTILWEAALSMIRDRPLLGYGYGAFWLGWDGPSAYVWQATKWDPPHSHNGLLDLWLDLGLLGVTVFVVLFVKSSLRAIKFLRLSTAEESLWPLLYLSFMLLYNTTESTILNSSPIFWILFVTTVISMLIEKEKITSQKLNEGNLHEGSHMRNHFST